MILSDRSIKEEIKKGRVVITPYDPKSVEPSSYDVRLDNKFLIFKHSSHAFIDVRKKMNGLMEMVTIKDDEPFILHPGEFILGSTFERIKLPNNIVARIEGKSSLGRLGILIHSTAGYVDPGWDGNLTLELSNVAKLPITLYYKMKIGQISFARMTTPVDKPYGSKGLKSKYHGDKGPSPSRFYQDF